MEDQIIELVARVGCVVTNLQQDNDQKDAQILSLKEQLHSEIIVAKRDTQ